MNSSYQWRLGILDQVSSLISCHHPYAATVVAAIQYFGINYRGAMFQELKPCCMRSQSHGRLWPLLKLKFGNCWLTSKCRGSSCKKINSGFQFQFQSLQFQFHFQFHQFQFQNWNWNWAAIPIPEMNWPQPCHLPTQYTTHIIMLQ